MGLEGLGQAGAEIIVTPEMIAAGVFELRDKRLGQSLTEVVTDVYLAMEIERQSAILVLAS